MDMAEIKQQAFKILARREYSRAELLRKLKQKFPDVEPDVMQQVLQQLESKNFQNDGRYAETMVRHRASQGYGPNYIKQSLRMQGISDELIQQALADVEINWQELALQQYIKHFGKKPVGDFKDRAKRMRYLYSRGFSQDMIESVL